MKALIVLLLSSTAAAATPMVCTVQDNKEVLDLIEKHSGEILAFVGIDSYGFPMEITVSKSGSWTMLVVTPKGPCFVFVGTNWQAVEQKLKGVEE